MMSSSAPQALAAVIPIAAPITPRPSSPMLFPAIFICIPYIIRYPKTTFTIFITTVTLRGVFVSPLPLNTPFMR